MKSYYTLIKINTNPISGDTLTIGLICFDGKEFRFMFSKNKKSLAKSLIKDNINTIDFLEKQIINKLTAINLKNNDVELFEPSNTINSDYFNYLSKYNNGILQFSKPTVIDDEINDDKFKFLFSIFVDKIVEEINTPKKNTVFSERIKSNLIEVVEENVHVNQNFTNDFIPSLLSNFQIDCIGLNGNLVGAKSLELTQSKQTLSAHTNSFINVIIHLSIKCEKDPLKNKFFLISDEPSSIDSLEHKIWESLRKEQLFKVINSEEVNTVVNIIENTKASRFLETLENGNSLIDKPRNPRFDG